MDNKGLHDEHNELTNKYKHLIKEYDATIVEQQKILSTTLMAVANLHQSGSEQIHNLLKEMSQVTGESKEACKSFGESFLQVGRLTSELTDLRDNLNTSIKELTIATKKNCELSDKLTALTGVLPKLITNQNAVNRKHFTIEKQSDNLSLVMRNLVFGNSTGDKRRAITMPDSREQTLLQKVLPPLEKRDPSCRGRKYRKL